MGGIINLKNRSTVFENNITRVIVPLDPKEGERYTEIVHGEEEVDHILKLTAWNEDWINPTMEGVLYWEADSECFSDSNEEMENWKNQLDDVLALQYLRVTRDFCCISLEVRDISHFDESGSIKEFLRIVEALVPRE